MFPLLIPGLVYISPASASELACGGRFEDKTMKLVVPSKAGGGYDLYSRLFVPHLEIRTGARVLW
jgi:tripartite-type tricarboxylate transporter receptor subunit TctC